MSDPGADPGAPVVPMSPITLPSGEDPEAARIRRIVQEELAKSAKQTQSIGWVTGLDPLTVRLKSGGDIGATARDASLALSIGQRVSLQWAGDGYIVTGLSTGPDDEQTTSGGVFPLGAVCLWPATAEVPDGWEEAVDLRGLFVVHANPGDAHFDVGQTGGGTAHSHTLFGQTNLAGSHDHGGNTGTQSLLHSNRQTGGTAAASPTHTHNIAGDASHSHNVGSGGGIAEAFAGNRLPPYTAAYIWIRRIA